MAGNIQVRGETIEKLMTRLQEETAKRLQHNLDRALGK